MRYPDGGGLTVQGRSRREQVLLQAAGMFAQDADARQVARSLRVSTKSVYQWRRAWKNRRRGGARLEGAGREPVQAGRRPGRAAARRLGGRPAGLRLGAGPAVDPGPGRRPGHAPVRRLVHAARGLVPAAPPGLQPAGPGAPGRGAGTRTRSLPGAPRRGRRYEASGADRRVYLLRGRGRPGPAAAPGPHLGAARAHPRRPGLRQDRAAVRRGHGLPEARPARPVSSTTSASTAGARASGPACPKPSTRT